MCVSGGLVASTLALRALVYSRRLQKEKELFSYRLLVYSVIYLTPSVEIHWCEHADALC